MNEKESGHCKVEELKMIYSLLIKLSLESEKNGPLRWPVYSFKKEREYFENKIKALDIV